MAYRHLSLKARLRLGTILLVTILVLALAGLNLHRAIEATFADVQARALTNAAQIRDFLLDRIAAQAAAAVPRPTNFEETKQLWTRIIREDQQLAELLVKAVANSNLVAEIYITDDQLRILNASNPARSEGLAPALPDYLTLQKRPIFERLMEILTRSQDYVLAIPLGEIGKDQEIFSIRIVTSSLLIGEAVRPELLNVGAVSAVAIGVSILYTFLFSNLMLRPIARIGETIDRIAAGEFSADPLRARGETPEVAALHSKLGVLDQQVRGARQDVLTMQGNIEQLLERMESVVLLFDRSHRLLMAGRPVERLFHLPLSQLNGRPVTDLFPPASPIGAAIQTAIQFNRPLTGLLVTHTTPTQESLRLLMSLDWSDGRLLVTLRDAESRQQLASLLDLSARLTAINRVTSGVAHEIKNPLNAIAIHLEVLRSRLASDDAETQTEVEIISREISRLDRVVKGFLSFTRPVEVSLDSLDLVPLVYEVAELVAPHAATPGVDIIVSHNTQEAMAMIDRDLFKQAVMNVTLNGIEAMPNGGILRLRLIASPHAVTVEISDQGGGISDELRARIFQLYFTTKPGGSGIGLATTFQAVQLMGGSISLTSEPGAGSTFRLSFHSASLPGAPPAPAMEKVPSLEA
jgi:signal transduction histidine kinase